MYYDVIIIGAGVAGLYASLQLPKDKRVLLLCKDQPWECNTFYAQGGIAVAKDASDVGLHVSDTLEAGAHMGDRGAIERLSLDSLEILSDLIGRGVPFDRDSSGKLLYTKEGAHTISRIVHAGGDGTGRVLHSHLIGSISHTLWKNATVTNLLLDESRCHGVSVMTKRGSYNLYANDVIIATGGVGALYEYHTNAYTISSDLHGMIIEHGGSVRDMEMMQFHPTVYVKGSHARKILLSEALRGEGARIVNEHGERFLQEYDSRGELAPRDVISRAIFDYKKQTNMDVYLDISDFEQDYFKSRFPNIYRNLTSYGFSIPGDKIPISPAFHYSMGGIEVDSCARVKGMDNLYAIGECARTGVHGANRLASNSLLEGLVFARIAANNIAGKESSFKVREFRLNDEMLEREFDNALKGVLRSLMWEKVGIARRKSELNEALGGVEVMLKSGIGRMLKMRLLTAREIIKGALSREESLGAHYMID
ncbi:MAG: L-aspartate oxidase [Wolinella sp.]